MANYHSEHERLEQMTRAYRTGILVTNVGYMLKISRDGSLKNGTMLLCDFVDVATDAG